MNLFVLDRVPVRAAQMQCDKHVTKMSIEYAQLLSAAHHIHQSHCAPDVYRLTHRNHPATRWVAAHPDHYAWTYALARATWNEYTYRYGRTHASSRLDALLEFAPHTNPLADASVLTQSCAPPQCMPDTCKVIGTSWRDVVAGYRAYYRDVKRSFATWKRREIPNWFADIAHNEYINTASSSQISLDTARELS